MAKLSARGRKVVVEVSREYDAETLQRQHDKLEAAHNPQYIPGSDPALTVWARMIKRLMSDGTILEKRDVRFRPNPNFSWEDPQGERHSYGWKVSAKLKTGKTADDYARIYESDRKDGRPSPWTVKREGACGPEPKVISQRRILAAIQSGEYIGFCTACGSEQGGVEPDAHGYKCESCGAHEVTGAEDLLMQSA